MCLKCRLFRLDLVITSLEAINHLIEIWHWHFEFLTIVTLVIGQVVDLVGGFQHGRHFPDAIIADKVLDHRAPAISVNV